VPFPSSSPTAVRPAGLGLFPVDARAELCAGERERTPLSTLPGENRGTPEGEEGRLEVGKGRQTWGSWRGVLGRGSRWVSGGYWEKQGKEDKVFI
jgi:axial budding pattern protein 2